MPSAGGRLVSGCLPSARSRLSPALFNAVQTSLSQTFMIPILTYQLGNMIAGILTNTLQKILVNSEVLLLTFNNQVFLTGA